MGPIFCMQDSAPCHKSRKTIKWLADHNIAVLDWPGNSPDLNPIENAWAKIKNELEDKDTSSVPCLKEALSLLWITMNQDYFKNLAHSMPTRLKKVTEVCGHMTKY